MSVSTVALIVESGLLAVALLFVVALLRSHAEILRRLVALEGRAVGAVPAAGAVPGTADGDAAPEHLIGQTPGGDAVKVSLAPGGRRTLLAFLSTGCAGCGPLWEGLRQGLTAPPGTRLVAVTKGPDRESPTRLLELGPFPHEVVMSSSAFADFAIPATPHFVLVGAEGTVQGRGSAGSWEQIMRLLGDADADADVAAARSSSGRAERAEQALAAAGITPDHPSLYPSRG